MSTRRTSFLIQCSRPLLRLTFVVFGFQIGCANLWGQAAELSGTVKDFQGAVIPEADLSLISAATYAKYTAKATAQGYYVFRVLSPGKYVLTCSAKGFQETRLENLTLD